jgi:hypothetical protein
MKILLGNFEIKVHRKGVNKLTVVNENLHYGNDNELLNFAVSRKLVLTM